MNDQKGPYKIEEDASGDWYLLFLGEHTDISGDHLCDGILKMCEIINQFYHARRELL
jgi:hypothetical protein